MAAAGRRIFYSCSWLKMRDARMVVRDVAHGDSLLRGSLLLLTLAIFWRA